MTFEVVVDHSSLEAAMSQTIAGRVHVVIDGRAFPEEGWWDFPCVILTGETAAERQLLMPVLAIGPCGA